MTMSHPHPEWCDPRVCRALGTENVDHRNGPMKWMPERSDTVVTTGLARLDSIDPHLGYIGTPVVHLELLDTGSVCRCGRERRVDCDLTSADARLLAAALQVVADQLDQVTRRAAA